jgi:hypothetical protein
MLRSDKKNHQANEAVSKFKLLSAYGGPGSIVHTAHGSIIISCIEEWGFIEKLNEIYDGAIELGEPVMDYLPKQARLEDICISNDERLLLELQHTKELVNLKFLALVPNIELNEVFNTVNDSKSYLAINSEFMPKGFYDRSNHYKSYKEWYTAWTGEKAEFFPPKYRIPIGNDRKAFDVPLKQDNIVLICKNGHLSDLPWSRFLRWRIDQPHDLNKEVDLFQVQTCCKNPDIQINETTANASGFDGKWLKCNNKGCAYGRGTSLKGLMSLKVVCPGHKPWESETGDSKLYFGVQSVRNSSPRTEPCGRRDLKVALTTGNNLYFSRVLTSIFMPSTLFLDEQTLKRRQLEVELQRAKDLNDFDRCITINQQIKEIDQQKIDAAEPVPMNDHERDVKFRFQEFRALSHRSVEEINVERDDLLVSDVTSNLDDLFAPYFQRVLRVDQLKVTSAQLDFTRVEPYEGGSAMVQNRNIFRSKPEQILLYPVVENYGEGIFFSFDIERMSNFTGAADRLRQSFRRDRNAFASGAVTAAKDGGSSLYAVHTFCHLIMRELEFRCGYPTASLSERLFVSNAEDTRMYGCLIYTAEGAEGSMGGLIAQTREQNLNDLIRSALLRSTICNSDPLCWQSDGQGLFELNLASCFSCGLVSETSCEHRNIFLDRRSLVDESTGFFKNIMPDLI